MRTKWCWLFIALLTSTALADPLPTADGYRGIWYSVGPTPDQYQWKYSGGMATYPQQHIPIAIYSAKARKTFFVFGGTTGNTNANRSLLLMISYFDHATGTVPRPRILLDKKTTDAHDNPVLSIDDAGHLYIFANAHGLARPSYIFRSTKPYRIEEFEQVHDVNFSYAQPWHIAGRGFLVFHTHYEKTGEHYLYWMTSTDGRKWTDRQPLARIPRGHYQISWPDPGKPNRLATVFDFHPRGLDTRTNLYYLQTTDFGQTWTTIDGTAVKTPLTTEDNPARIHDYHSQKLNVYLKDLQFDESGRPVILYLTSKGARPGPDNAPYTFHTTRWTGRAWESRPLTTTDHNYDHGSLYIASDDSWNVIAPTDPGPIPFSTGGEMVVWKSINQGRSWTRIRELLSNSDSQHTYLRRPLNAHPQFWALWADGHGHKPSDSSIYFTNQWADGVWRLPANMTGDSAKPELVQQTSLDWIRPSEDRTHFILQRSRNRFLIWGFNYDRDDSGRLVEDYWHDEWQTVVEDFREMKSLGANVVRIHLQLAKFMTTADQPNQQNLERLRKLVKLAEQTNLYLDITGLGCYHKKDVPAWYDALDESSRWNVQSRFWKEVATVCKRSPAIFCYNLMNEPLVSGGDEKDKWLPGKPFGGKHFVQRITTNAAGRSDVEIAKAWVAQLTSAIREVDDRHMITVGVIPWAQVFKGAKPLFYSPEVSAPLDFVSVHFYPKAENLEADLAALRVYQVGKPLVIEEIFPLGASIEKIEEFIAKSRSHVDGYISFYWGKTIDENKAKGDPAGALTSRWLERFSKLSPSTAPPANQ